MEIKVFELGPYGTNGYLVTKAGRAIMIDAPLGAWKEIQPYLKGRSCVLEGLILTHGHWDHTLDAVHFQEHGVKIYAHMGDRGMIEHPELLKGMIPEGMDVKAVKVNRFLDDGEILDFIGEEWEVRHVPGHAPGSLMIYNEGRHVAFVGDVIFQGSVGRTDLPGGSFETLERSIREKIYTLADNVVLYPGHGDKTTVAAEKASNPYVSDLKVRDSM